MDMELYLVRDDNAIYHVLASDTEDAKRRVYNYNCRLYNKSLAEEFDAVCVVVLIPDGVAETILTR